MRHRGANRVKHRMHVAGYQRRMRRGPRCGAKTIRWWRGIVSFKHPRAGGAHDSQHRTAGIADRSRRRGSRMAARRASAAGGDARDRISQQRGIGPVRGSCAPSGIRLRRCGLPLGWFHSGPGGFSPQGLSSIGRAVLGSEVAMRAFKTLRDFLELLESDKQLLRITDAVSLEPDLAAAGRAVNQTGGETSPALLFNNIKGFAKAEVAMNAHGSWPNLALMLGMEKDASLTQQFFEFVRRYRLFPGKMDHRTSAPWQEVVIENDINLFSLLPLFRLNQGDGGFYIDKACIVSRDPDNWNNEDIQNVGMYRLQVKGKNRLGIQPVPMHDIAIHLEHAEARGEDLPVAIAIGNEPIS